MDVSAVGLARVVREALPPPLVQLGQVGLVLCVDDVNRPAGDHDDVGHEVAERSVRGVAPLQWADCLTLAPYTDAAADESRLPSNKGLDVVLPQLVKRKGPRQPVHLATPAEAALVHDPA